MSENYIAYDKEYVYHCLKCDTLFDDIGERDVAIICPECKKMGYTTVGILQRELFLPAENTESDGESCDSFGLDDMELWSEDDEQRIW